MVFSVSPRRSLRRFSVLMTMMSSPSSGKMTLVHLPSVSGETPFICR